jgi:hypothetical protein
VTSAFGGQRSEACGRLPGGIAYRQPERIPLSRSQSARELIELPFPFCPFSFATTFFPRIAGIASLKDGNVIEGFTAFLGDHLYRTGTSSRPRCLASAFDSSRRALIGDDAWPPRHPFFRIAPTAEGRLHLFIWKWPPSH